MKKLPIVFSMSLALFAAQFPLQADEIEEEVRSTIPSDPESGGKKPSSSPSDEDGEWRTMHSEKGRRIYSGGKSSAVKVDLEKKRIFTPKITFGSNSATPTPPSQGVIKQVAAVLLKKPELTVRVEGHTDTIGYDQPNLELSQKRADKVRDLLAEAGVPANRVQSVGMGDRYPLASSATAEGQEKNRRVEIHIAEVAAAPSTPQLAPAAPAPEPAPVTEPALTPVAPLPAPATPPEPAPEPVVPAAIPAAPVTPDPAPAPAPAPAPTPQPAPTTAAPEPTPPPTSIPAAPPAPAPMPEPAPAPAPSVPSPAPTTPPQGV